MGFRRWSLTQEGSERRLHLRICFPCGVVVKNFCLPVQETQEMQVLFLGQEDSLEEEMATHSSILTRKIPRTEEHGGLQSTGSLRVGHDWAHAHTHTHTPVETDRSKVSGSNNSKKKWTEYLMNVYLLWNLDSMERLRIN